MHRCRGVTMNGLVNPAVPLTPWPLRATSTPLGSAIIGARDTVADVSAAGTSGCCALVAAAREALDAGAQPESPSPARTNNTRHAVRIEDQRTRHVQVRSWRLQREQR